MLPSVGEVELDLHGAVFDGRSQVLGGHRGQRRTLQSGAQVWRGAGRVAHLEPGESGDADQAAFDPGGPVGGVGTGADPDQSGLVDQPGGHRQAWSITCGSARSPNRSANRVKSATLTSVPETTAS